MDTDRVEKVIVETGQTESSTYSTGQKGYWLRGHRNSRGKNSGGRQALLGGRDVEGSKARESRSEEEGFEPDSLEPPRRVSEIPIGTFLDEAAVPEKVFIQTFQVIDRSDGGNKGRNRNVLLVPPPALS